MKTTVPLTPTQARFLANRSREAEYRGGLGAGKTFVLSHWAGPRAWNGRRVILTEPTYPMVRDVLVPTLEETLETLGLPYSRNRSTWDYQIGRGWIKLRSGDRPDSLRGINADDAGMDEASYQKVAVYDQLIARTRGAEDAEIRLVGTPNGRDWVYKLGKDPAVAVFTQSTFKNPFLPRTYKEHLAKRYTSEIARQELLGEIIDLSVGVISSRWFVIRQDPTFAPVVACRSWDLAATAKEYSDYTAGVRLSTNFERWRLEDIRRFKGEWPEVRARIIQTAHEDGRDVPIVLEAVGMQKALVHELRAAPDLRGFQVVSFTPVGSKFNRLLTWTPKAEKGLVEVAPGKQTDEFFEEADEFTADDSHAHDDIIDAVSQAFVWVLENPTASSGGAVGLY